MSDCIFCRIAAGDIPAKKVFEDDEFVAFHDLNPVAPVHLLLIPKRHLAGLDALGADDRPLAGGLLTLATRLARQEGLPERGWRVVVNSGADGGQTVFHLHLHLLGGRAFDWPPG